VRCFLCGTDSHPVCYWPSAPDFTAERFEKRKHFLVNFSSPKLMLDLIILHVGRSVNIGEKIILEHKYISVRGVVYSDPFQMRFGSAL
jgi:hypothetical protein